VAECVHGPGRNPAVGSFHVATYASLFWFALGSHAAKRVGTPGDGACCGLLLPRSRPGASL